VSWLTDLMGVYGRVLRRAFELTLKHWWLGPVAIGYLGVFFALAIVASQLGFAGGFLLAIGMAALMSSWLVLVGHVVRTAATIADIPESFLVYLGDVITFLFFRMLLNWVANAAFADVSYVAIVRSGGARVPERRARADLPRRGNTGLRSSSRATLRRDVLDRVAARATALFIVPLFAVSVVPVPIVALVLGGIVMAFGFIARGLLFLELTTSSRRAREFARQSAG
jgi:hypothetical protein